MSDVVPLSAQRSLPHAAARSHWDRLPRELRDMALAAAGPFTQFINGALMVAELRTLAPALKEALWTDALELDWDGDLRWLPPIDSWSGCFLCIRSRAGLARVRAANVAQRETLVRVVVRNRWTDLFDAGGLDDLALHAALEGALWLLQDLVDVRRVVRPRVVLAESAASVGHLAVVEWLHARMPAEPWHPSVMDHAAGSGNLALVAWLHTNRPEGCTEIAMDLAAKYGHLDVIAWLRANRSEGCSPHALALAAAGGHYDVCVYLLEHYADRFTDLDDDALVHTRDLRVLRLLHARGMLKDKPGTLVSLAQHGDVASVQWACAALAHPPTRGMLEVACEHNRVDLVRWLLAQPGVDLDDAALDAAVANSALGVLALIVKRGRRLFEAIADRAVRDGNVELARWLHARHPGGFTQRSLEIAVEHRHATLVAFLFLAVGGEEWDLTRARLLAADWL
ncbi:hypothetical protein HK105_204693 [Polyrhizophydium stewartii]|uniref:Ankyrin repeat protein n=1 Tax=Polyrhizophydium stewartii TaxID=2732419 RepID=A0ABR4N8B4_9FUNG